MIDLEIVTPEAVLYKGKVTQIGLPGAKGGFQILENHAPIISVLEKGQLSFKTSSVAEIFIENKFEKQAGTYVLNIEGGAVEQNENRVIVLAE